MDTLSAARTYLNTSSVLCLATVQGEQPWVAPVFYSVFGDGLVFLSAPHTRHCQNIACNPRVSASIQKDYNDWQDIKGIQLEGSVVIVPDAHKPQVIERYSQKFPVTGESAPPEIAKALDKIQWFQLKVQRLLYIDNSQGLGYRQEVDPVALFRACQAGDC